MIIVNSSLAGEGGVFFVCVCVLSPMGVRG